MLSFPYFYCCSYSLLSHINLLLCCVLRVSYQHFQCLQLPHCDSFYCVYCCKNNFLFCDKDLSWHAPQTANKRMALNFTDFLNSLHVLFQSGLIPVWFSCEEQNSKWLIFTRQSFKWESMTVDTNFWLPICFSHRCLHVESVSLPVIYLSLALHGRWVEYGMQCILLLMQEKIAQIQNINKTKSPR